MRIVDASALTAVVLKEDGWEKIISLLVPAYSVDHVTKEVMNAIWKMKNVKRAIDDNTALGMKKILFDVLKERTLILLNEMDYLEDAFQIAINNDLTLYDSLYISACLKRGAQLITTDVKQAKIAEKLDVQVITV
ncbi:type II toxin-antitoxin system VapC family toxin [Metallosphaera tengchongensis]|uniref:Type II toxin-antitoxin system VapC family toxin n=1 Tax=Metallosphaera tengchongensis TaxID=1532350 RepID=A0A6N0NY33_9CREN|nr:type II toxin-antitoxin system VapC family toxin [Metallosphaera tengchongensis]QKR00288.1 type II toxin-antitoxin system VapC family toxin [Metallosphaera tengchongensis]